MCSVFLSFLDFEPKTCPVLPSDAVAKEVALHAECGAWDSSLVRESSEWKRDDVFSKVLAGRVFVILGVKFAERLLIGMQRPASTAIIADLTVLRTPRLRVECWWKFSALLAKLEQSDCVCDYSSRGTQVAREPCPAKRHQHDYELMWFGSQSTLRR